MEKQGNNLELESGFSQMGQQPAPECEQEHKDIKTHLLLADALHMTHSQNEKTKTMQTDI